MTENQLPAHVQMMNFASAKFISKPLWVAAQIGIADLLADGSKTTDQLAQETETHEQSLYRVLRALACVGIFTEVEPRTFALTPLAATLLSDAPNSVRDAVMFLNHPVHDLAWTEIIHSVKTGMPGFDRAHGMPVFEYFQQNAEFSEVFNRAMTSLARNDVAAVADSYDFDGIGRLVDVGGGHGALMTTILDRYPAMTGVVFDLPHVVDGTRKSLESSGHAFRCEAMGGDFFASVPGGDAIIMSHIIHDWDDERSVAILSNCAKALPDNGKVLICEAVIPTGDAFSPAKLLDLEMLLLPGGQERTREEFEGLLNRAGFRLNRIVPTQNVVCVIEGVRV